MRKLAVVVIAVIVFVSFAVPAAGGPSVSRVYRVAKKALGKARAAQRTANSANRRAGSAAVRFVSADATVPAGGDVYTLSCPAGYAAVGWGATPVNGANSVLVGGSTIGRQAILGWYTANGDTVHGYVSCVRSNDATVASVSQVRSVRKRIEREIAARR